MKAHELLDQRWRTKHKGFKVKNGRVVWTEAWAHGDRKRVGVSRMVPIGKRGVGFGQVFRKCTRYLKPHQEVELV